MYSYATTIKVYRKTIRNEKTIKTFVCVGIGFSIWSLCLWLQLSEYFQLNSVSEIAIMIVSMGSTSKWICVQ